MAEVTVTIPSGGWSVSGSRVRWNVSGGLDGIQLSADLNADGTDAIYLGFFQLWTDTGDIRINLHDMLTGLSSSAGPDFTMQMETSGTITMVASDSSSVAVTGISDATEPYEWTPTNSTEVAAFATTLASLTDRTLTVTFSDNAETAPATPSAPTLTVNSQTQITAVGVAPDDGGDSITGYDWRYKKTADAGWIDRLDAGSFTQIFAGLDVGTEYEVQFRATNSVGDSDYSPSATATTDASPATVPASFGVEAGDPTLDISARAIAPAAPISASFSANAGDSTLTIDARAIAPSPPIAAAFGMEAGDATLSISARAIAPVITLLLSDFDDAGLEVDAAALLVASAPGTTGNNPYADSDRGGVLIPHLDGELGLSSYPDGYQ